MKINHQIILIFLTFFFTAISCSRREKDNNTIEGDLYFRAFRYGSFFNEPESVINAFVAFADTANIDSVSSYEKELLTTYFLIKKERCLYSPYVELRVDDSSIVKLYLDSVDYDKIKAFKLHDLQRENKVIRIKANCVEIGKGLSICKKIISISKLDGLTLEHERKFKIDDYD